MPPRAYPACRRGLSSTRPEFPNRVDDIMLFPPRMLGLSGFGSSTLAPFMRWECDDLAGSERLPIQRQLVEILAPGDPPPVQVAAIPGRSVPAGDQTLVDQRAREPPCRIVDREHSMSLTRERERERRRPQHRIRPCSPEAGGRTTESVVRWNDLRLRREPRVEDHVDGAVAERGDIQVAVGPGNDVGDDTEVR